MRRRNIWIAPGAGVDEGWNETKILGTDRSGFPWKGNAGYAGWEGLKNRVRRRE